jgi:NADP-dependent 3-hydroxy acid dehydrogenase YdfG
MKDVVGKVAFITGGASGMGLAMARSFTAAGMKVVVADVEQAALDAVEEEFADTNASVLCMRVDVTDRAAMTAAAEASVAHFGKVHVVVNNAGVAVGGAMDTMSGKDWDWVLRVNLDGVVNGLLAFVECIKSHGEGGHIVNTASMAGHLAIPGLGVYNASKWAVVGISETLKADLAPHNIGVSVLCPGVVKTNIFSSGRNRPEVLQGDSATDDLTGTVGGGNSGDASQRMAAIMDGALDASVVGEMVLHAIQSDELYIFTHPEFKTAVGERFEALNAAFDRWQDYRQINGI